MTDILERLKSWQSSGFAPECYKAARDDMAKAHDEIERLRWELRSYKQLGGDAERYAAQWRDENPIDPRGRE